VKTFWVWVRKGGEIERDLLFQEKGGGAGGGGGCPGWKRRCLTGVSVPKTTCCNLTKRKFTWGKVKGTPGGDQHGNQKSRRTYKKEEELGRKKKKTKKKPTGLMHGEDSPFLGLGTEGKGEPEVELKNDLRDIWEG